MVKTLEFITVFQMWAEAFWVMISDAVQAVHSAHVVGSEPRIQENCTM